MFSHAQQAAAVLMAAAATPVLAAAATAARYDYVVVGGGTAGMTVANRLTEDPSVTVAVIEAGKDRAAEPIAVIPGLFSTQVNNPEHDWMFVSPPQPGLNNRKITQPRGKQIGGSSGMNIMVVMHPSKGDIDAWGEMGNKGWSFDALRPYFQKMASVQEPSQNAKDVAHVDEWYDPSLNGANNGPIKLSWGSSYSPILHGAWCETWGALGLNMTNDPRSGNAIGGFQNMATIDATSATRSYAGNAHYGAEQRARSNLVVLTETVAKKILFADGADGADGKKRAHAVVVRDAAGQEIVLGANTEVILAAGALQSPQILELSGVGDRALLEKHNIPVVIENPNVGEHLQDHAIAVQLFETLPDAPTLDQLKKPDYQAAALAEYMANKTGLFSQSALSSAYTPFMYRNDRLQPQDVQKLLDTHLGPASRDSREVAVTRKMFLRENYNQMQYHLFPTTMPTYDADGNFGYVANGPHVAAMTMLNHPLSRGHVHIVSDSVDTKPEWDPKMLSHPLDIELIARSAMFVENLVTTDPLQKSLTGTRYPTTRGDTVEAAKEIVRAHTISSYHPCGSLSMRPQEEGGVVDARLKVYGTENVRVVDASVFPLETSGNIMILVYAVAERAADIIKEDRQ